MPKRKYSDEQIHDSYACYIDNPQLKVRAIARTYGFATVPSMMVPWRRHGLSFNRKAANYTEIQIAESHRFYLNNPQIGVLNIAEQFGFSGATPMYITWQRAGFVLERHKARGIDWGDRNAINAYYRMRRREDPEHMRLLERAKARRWRKKYPEKALANGRRWRSKNPEKTRASVRRWSKQNPEKRRAVDRRRRARKAATVCNLTAEQEREILSLGCLFCGAMEDLNVAHDISVSGSGDTTFTNCFCLCKICNSKMGTKRLSEYLEPLRLSC